MYIARVLCNKVDLGNANQSPLPIQVERAANLLHAAEMGVGDLLRWTDPGSASGPNRENVSGERHARGTTSGLAVVLLLGRDSCTLPRPEYRTVADFTQDSRHSLVPRQETFSPPLFSIATLQLQPRLHCRGYAMRRGLRSRNLARPAHPSLLVERPHMAVPCRSGGEADARAKTKRNRTYDGPKTPYIPIFSHLILGPDYRVPP